MIREPAVAGQFYPATAETIESALDDLMPPGTQPQRAIAVMVPHAGWMYSGRTAGLVYASVAIPDHVILLGPNHRGVGAPYAMYDAGTWRLPCGDVPIDETLAAMLFDECDLLASDPSAHRWEHSLEVQAPMLMRRNPHVRVTPILIGGGWPEAGGRRDLRELGAAIANTVRAFGKPVLLVASSDLNHYEDQPTAAIKDKLALDAVLNLDPDAMMDRVKDVEISMCGVATVYIVLEAALKLGATRAELIDYRTSGDVTGDYSAVVGYGGARIW